MSDALAIYLHDHLAGSKLAVDLLKNMQADHAGRPLGRFAAELLDEVEKDRSVLKDIADRAGKTSPVSLKEGAGWLAEKATWLKLRTREGTELGWLLSLETLALGIHGKLGLWNALSEIAPYENILDGVDLGSMKARAEAQHARVEERRREVAHHALRRTPD